MPEFQVIESPVDENLRLPIRSTADKTVRWYEFEPCSARALIRMQALQETAVAVLLDRDVDRQELEVIRDMPMSVPELVLGRQNAKQMLDDEVGSRDMTRAISTVLFWHTSGGDTELATAVWEGRQGKAKAPTAPAKTR